MKYREELKRVGGYAYNAVLGALDALFFVPLGYASQVLAHELWFLSNVVEGLAEGESLKEKLDKSIRNNMGTDAISSAGLSVIGQGTLRAITLGYSSKREYSRLVKEVERTSWLPEAAEPVLKNYYSFMQHVPLNWKGYTIAGLMLTASALVDNKDKINSFLEEGTEYFLNYEEYLEAPSKDQNLFKAFFDGLDDFLEITNTKYLLETPPADKVRGYLKDKGLERIVS